MRRVIKELLKAIYFIFFKNPLVIYYDLYTEIRFRKKRFGNKNPDKFFCIITPTNSAYGAFAHWQRSAYLAIIAERHGFIPVFDFQNYKTSFWQGKEADKDENWWDFYFKQYQSDIKLDEVYQSKHVLFIKELRDSRNDIWLLLQILYKEQLTAYKNMYRKIGAVDDIAFNASNFQIPKRTCGIPLRRSMEWGNKIQMPLYANAVAHHQRGTLSSYVKWIERQLDEGLFDYFFVASDDQEAIDILEQKFGEKCLHYNRIIPYRFRNGKPVSLENLKAQQASIDFIKYTKDYITETILLSKCDMLLSVGTTSQSKMPLIISDKAIKVIHDPVISEAD